MYGVVVATPVGPVWVRTIIALVLAGAVVVALFGWVFPAIAPHMPFNQLTVGE